MDKEPLDIIEQNLENDNKPLLSEYKVAKSVILFFNKLQESKINYRIFHPRLVSVIEKMGKFCIYFSFRDISFWSEEQYIMETVKLIYKNYRKLCLNDESSLNV